jgi:hypothetical protein
MARRSALSTGTVQVLCVGKARKRPSLSPCVIPCNAEAHHRSWQGITREPGLRLQGYHILQISKIGLLHKDP